MEELSITVSIADRKYNLAIERQEEEIVRQAAKVIDRKMKEYAKSYAFKDGQDLLAMVALQFTTSSLKYEQTSVFNETQFEAKLTSIDRLLTEITEQI